MDHITKNLTPNLGRWLGDVPQEEKERRMALILKGCENAKKAEGKKQAYIKVKYGWRMRKEGDE